MNVLFVCSMNHDRSRTAEEIFRGRPGIEVRSAGIRGWARVRIDDELVEWADIIIVMEGFHKEYIRRTFPNHAQGKRIEILGIPDQYLYMDPALVDRLEKATTKILDI
ncbi:hypothetical protein LJC45_06100 [Alistipes sp. OttesenSCG-928-B03]|nr:hypothetical protein [Alistipes sp. OttesenSCG-928-B03]